MKNKVEEMNLVISELRKIISVLEEKLAKEESDKLVSLPVQEYG